MTILEIVKMLSLQVVAGHNALDQSVTGGYVSDLLSNVMGNALAGNVWVTMQGHQNVIAVASLSGLSGVIIAGGAEPDKDAIAKAEKENIPLMITKQSAFEVVGALHQAGITGKC